MDVTLAGRIAANAYALAPAALDDVARRLGNADWTDLTRKLTFAPWPTGGGCMMLVAEVPGTGGHHVGITDGEVGLPTGTDTFWFGLLDPDGEELLLLDVQEGHLLR